MISKKFKREFGKSVEKAIQVSQKKVEKNGEFTSTGVSKITATEKKIFEMLIIEGLSIKQIADRRKTKDKAVYKIIKNLERKGILKHGHYATNFFSDVLQAPEIKKGFLNLSFRYHGCEYNIGLIEKSDFYERLRQRKNMFYFEGCAIRLYERSIEVYQNESESFFGKTIEEAVGKAQEYFTKLFWKLENRLKVTIIKGENSIIKQVKGHLSQVNNELAKEYNKKKLTFKVFGTKDNKLWFQIDNSFNLNEAECVHPEEHIGDMKIIERYFNDIRKNDVMLPSQVGSAISSILEFHMNYAENFQSHVSAINTLSQSVQELTKIVKELKGK